MATSLPEFMLALANAQGKNIKQNTENYYLPQEKEAAIGLKQGQLAEIPQKILLAAATQRLREEQTRRMAGLMNLDKIKQAQGLRELQAPNYQNNYAKALYDTELIKQQYGVNSPEYRQAQMNLSRMAAGNSMEMYDPATGKLIFRSGKGGSGSSTMGGAKEGETFVDENGVVRSRPTRAVTTRLQQQVIGEKAIEAGIDNIITDIGGYLGYKKGNLIWDKLNTQFDDLEHTDLANYEAAMASLKLRAEGLIRAAGLNVTDLATQLMMDVVHPSLMTNEKTYRARIHRTLDYLRKQQEAASESLAQGIPVGQANNWNGAKGDLQ